MSADEVAPTNFLVGTLCGHQLGFGLNLVGTTLAGVVGPAHLRPSSGARWWSFGGWERGRHGQDRMGQGCAEMRENMVL